MEVFARWFEHATSSSSLPNPNAMTVATVGASGKPTARIVLLKAFDDRGFVFFTNRESRKGMDLKANPRSAMVLHWDHLDQQVRIEGSIEKVDESESDAYFDSRARESRLNALASDQSRPIESREALEARRRAVDEKYPEGTDPPRPPHWGGCRLVPDRIEFWQGHPFRLHDRVIYDRIDDRWKTSRLMP
jgi:pyridoxamine 5'-phosphate oxidase